MNLAQLFSHWKQVRADLLSTIDRFEDADLSFTPFESSWSAGKIMLHIADAEEGWFRHAVTRQLDRWPDRYTLENYPTREAIKSALEEVHARTVQFLGSLDEADAAREVVVPWGETYTLLWIVWHVLEHEVHHRGELSLILGMLGREGLDV